MSSGRQVKNADRVGSRREAQAYSGLADKMQVSKDEVYFSFSEQPDYSLAAERGLGLPESEFKACAALILKRADAPFLSAILFPQLAGRVAAQHWEERGLWRRRLATP